MPSAYLEIAFAHSRSLTGDGWFSISTRQGSRDTKIGLAISRRPIYSRLDMPFAGYAVEIPLVWIIKLLLLPVVSRRLSN